MLWKKLRSESRTVFIFADNGTPQRNYASGNFFWELFNQQKSRLRPQQRLYCPFYSMNTGQVLKLLRKWGFQVGMDMVDRFGLGISEFFVLVRSGFHRASLKVFV